VTDDPPCPQGELLSLARAGDRAAFTALVRRHQRSVYSLALRMLWNPDEAQDLAQDVFMQLHRKLAQIHSDEHLVFWLRKVATHLAIDRLRRDARYELRPLDDEAAAVEELGAEGPVDGDPLLARRLRALIARLPPAARAVVLLRYQEDMDPVDIAETLEMPVNTVKSHLKRSLASLREMLGGAGEVSAGDGAERAS
jgi:RNA polymerase sigma-70 factor, ECF subfamily